MELLDIRHGGRTIRGALHLPPPAGSPAPALVLCHGFGGNRAEFGYTFVRLADRLAERGVAAYRFDFAGCGDSDGDFADLTVSDQVSQAVAILDAVGGHPAVDGERISLLGMSLGGLTASLAAAERPVRSLALWAPAAAAVAMDEAAARRRADAIAEHGYDDFGGLPVHRRFTDDAEHIDPFADAAAYAGPVLLAVGSDDFVLGPDLLDRYRGAYGERLDLHVFEGVGHGFETVPARERLIRLTEDFVARHA
ncbi:alpha/beta fold hydrolase [Glycomyces sp. TRM65418]|uniref:alpha/beta hydrolase family protein n=1 Tax=Glycomyces sp. TRM65418 TaxID=2867006 RepID=UPI001CE581F6|nr:alpha/beta fold hydrolase [Glycomyces sp. TRM65418]MCC3765920.1 alpha/beta fold hydrolase [Glycomyces sp. TRM65418]QZD55502.1 alpha/beta fold hydrolase [Glycomyces sp. TRM65418]